ncbi:pyridoxamine 5'-phosphate oxidase family protein [Vibrio aquimaris]|uniref:Pyridoxamine 5'-phosphate oxidase n=1 Tax=Vibrio aquimaris TaxID=2587862 RepID=A0A5P9CRM5_9VIBR|nr:pyridoxamine 5'-phosphate oxidase family protein [Vibrio aquimaris]QFT28633.1 Pyridoxamine 5'-phosphate oxidase [Vibrio aquimaris]
MQIIEKSRNLDLDEFLSQPLYAFLASESQDGPCCSPVWFLWEDGKIWIISVKGDSFSKRVAQQPKSAISIVDWDRASGKSIHAGLRGIANVHEFDSSRAERLLNKYLGNDKSKWNARFIDFQSNSENVFVCFEPEKVVLRDQSY